MENTYAQILSWSLRHKKFVIAMFAGVFVAALFLTPFIGKEFSPEEDTGDLRLTINLPLGTRLEETDRIAYRIEEIIQNHIPEAQFIFTRTGDAPGRSRAVGQSSGPHIITSGAKLVAKTQRQRSDKDIAQFLRQEISKIPGILKIDVMIGNPVGRMITGTGGKVVQVEIIGNSFEETDRVATHIKRMMEAIPGAVDVSISRELNRPELLIHIHREKAALLGLNMSHIAQSLNTAIAGSTATKYREQGETYDIVVRLEESSRQKIEDLYNLSLVSLTTGAQVKLSNIATIQEVLGPVDIERQNRERVVRVECNTFKRSSGRVVEDIRKSLSNIVLSSNITISIGGQAEEQQKAFQDLGLLLLLGIILVYMIMAAQFESLVDPFIVMFAVPFTFVGVIIAMFLTGTTLSIISYLGVIMLMGIVVNNAIVLISYIIILRGRGSALAQAVAMAGKDRLRPVLMTTATTLAGFLPLAISRGVGSETWQPLGITMSGGLMVSTIITLIFVPTLYSVIHKERTPHA